LAVSTPTVLTTGSSSGSTSSDTSASFSPTANCLLLCWIGTNSSGGGSTHAISDTLTGTGTWTQVTGLSGGTRGSWFYAIAGSSPGSGTVTFTYSPNATRCAWIILELNGHDTVTPVAESIVSTGSGATLSAVLTNIDTDHLGVSAIIDKGNSSGVTPGTNETELADITSSGSNEARCQAQHSTDETQDWSGLASNDQVGIALEVAAAAGNSVPPKSDNYHRRRVA